MVSKDEDEAFEQELKAAPWAYGQRQEPSLTEILARMRAHGLDLEADVVVKMIAGFYRDRP
jgi:hypothetical protein